jgi:hypothetical protein
MTYDTNTSTIVFIFIFVTNTAGVHACQGVHRQARVR